MKAKKIWISLTAVLLSVAIISSCKKDKYVPINGMCPTVISTNPADKATLVPRNKVISVTFNEKMNPASITQESFVLFQGANKIAGTILYDESTPTMSFVPSATLLANTSYTGRVTTAVKDLLGNALQTDYVWTFMTGITSAIIYDVTPPTVMSTDPADGATGVVLNKVVRVTFSEQMNSITISPSTFFIKQAGVLVPGTISYSGLKAFFTPSSNLIPNAVYMATVTTGAKDLVGNALASSYTWSFTTSSSPTAFLPLVISTDPANNATGVPLNKIITATFNEQMDALTITPSTFLLKEGANSIAGTVSYAGNTASFTPSSPLLNGTLYSATITTGAKDLAANALSNDYVWTFSTVPTIVVPVVSVIDLKSVGHFGIISGAGVSNSAGLSEIHDMDVGISPGPRSSITGFPPAVVINGTIFASDDIAPPGVPAMLVQAKQDLTDAYLFAEAMTNPAPVSIAGDIGGLTLAPGVYKSTSTLLIQGGNLTLDAQGDPNAFWVFQISSAFTTVGGAGGSIILAGGAQAKNIFWQTGSSATIGDYTAFQGTILALTSITMNAYSTAVGRMLCRNGSVVLTSTNIINKP
ncbi:MAG: Ig-like domain-containing protein [Bacteroidetes bacterium]|nr:Ig-like domain-containing protein [Bacteroidota bacterium]